jgi:toxin-antitoxin system PIN domain toxin
VTGYLLDINILLGIAWEDQEAHATVFPWFQQTGRHQFATCGITQTGFVRISSSVRFGPNAVSVKEAFQAMDSFTAMAGHEFWPIELGLRAATAHFVDKLFGPMQLTDAYLLGLAIARDGVLVTRDKAIPQIAGAAFAGHVLLLN